LYCSQKHLRHMK